MAVCISGVNNKKSNIVEQITKIFPGSNIYYHTYTNKTNLVPAIYHDNLFTMHYPKWHYHPMEANRLIGIKHGKFQKYVDKKLLWDELYFGIAPIIAHSDLVKKIPQRFDLIVRVDWNTKLDPQVNLQHWIRKAYEKGPVGFMIRENRGPEFGKGLVEEVDKINPNPEDDWYGFLPSSLIIHHRKHLDHSLVRKFVREYRLAPAQWGWYQMLSEPYNDIHTSVHGFAQEIK